MKKQIILIAILLCTAFAQAQEVFVTADFVSSYIWRGIENGNASVQPSLGLNWKGLTVYAWGSTEFRKKNNEIDLSLEYEYKNLTLYANNYFTQTEEEPFKYFNYSSHSTGHTFEVGAGYVLSEKFPLSVSWYTCLVQLLRIELSVQRERCKHERRSRFYPLGEYVLRQIQCSQYRIIRNERNQNNVQLLSAHIRKANSQPL